MNLNQKSVEANLSTLQSSPVLVLVSPLTECAVSDMCFIFSLQSNLSGFYDPCPEEEKMLRIRYLFRDAVHEVTFGDKEAVRIPKQCKLCCSALCAVYNAGLFLRQTRLVSVRLLFLSQSKAKLVWGWTETSQKSRADKLHVQLIGREEWKTNIIMVTRKLHCVSVRQTEIEMEASFQLAMTCVHFDRDYICRQVEVFHCLATKCK